jgi:hypothetical protein
MAARSTGVFPREKFDLDAALAVTATPTAAAIDLKSIKTIRVIVLGASGIDNAGTNKITVNVGGEAVVFNANDLDNNGVGIAHIRGSLCDANNNIDYDLGGTAALAACYIDAVDNVG